MHMDNTGEAEIVCVRRRAPSRSPSSSFDSASVTDSVGTTSEYGPGCRGYGGRDRGRGRGDGHGYGHGYGYVYGRYDDQFGGGGRGDDDGGDGNNESNHLHSYPDTDGGILYMKSPRSRSTTTGGGANNGTATGPGPGPGPGTSPSAGCASSSAAGSPSPVTPRSARHGAPAPTIHAYDDAMIDSDGETGRTRTRRPPTYPYQYQNRYAQPADPSVYPYNNNNNVYPYPHPPRAEEGRSRWSSGTGDEDESEVGSVIIPVHAVGDLEGGRAGERVVAIENGKEEEREEEVVVVRGQSREDGVDGEAGYKTEEKGPRWSQSESQPQEVRRHGHSFFSPQLQSCRASYFKIVLRATLLTIILIWAVLPIYWGSLSASFEKTGNLEVWLINRDHARIGDSLQAAVIAAPTTGPGALWWRVLNDTRLPDEDSVIQGVVNERTWAAVVVNANATSNLSAARFAGDNTFNPASAISVYYAQARNEVVHGTYLLPLVTSFLNNFTTNYSTGSAQRYLAAIVSNNGSVNVTALNSIAQAPQTISPGVSYELRNVRPYTTPEAQAPLLVGQIYLCIFAFIIVMAHTTARSAISSYLTLPSYLLLRILVPLLIYLPLSLSYALISVAFKLPFNSDGDGGGGGGGGTRSYGKGFMTFFAFVYLGMAALGLALEAMVTILGPRFVPFFLVLLIIVNVSTCVLPPELQPGLYSYGSGFQFWNIQQATRTILFDTYNHMGKNAGILIAWVLISCCTTALFTWFVRYREVRRMYRGNNNNNENRGNKGNLGKTRGNEGGDEGSAGWEEKGKWKGKGKVVDEEYGRPSPVPVPEKGESKEYEWGRGDRLERIGGKWTSIWHRRRKTKQDQKNEKNSKDLDKVAKSDKPTPTPTTTATPNNSNSNNNNNAGLLGLSPRERWERMKNSYRNTGAGSKVTPAPKPAPAPGTSARGEEEKRPSPSSSSPPDRDEPASSTL